VIEALANSRSALSDDLSSILAGYAAR